MVTAELNEVGEIGRSSARPVRDVVGVHEAAFAAAGEAATPVTALQRPSEGRRHAPRLPPDREGPAVALEDSHQTAVAGKTAGGLRMERGAALKLADAVLAVARERFRLHMHDNLVPLSAPPGAGT